MTEKKTKTRFPKVLIGIIVAALIIFAFYIENFSVYYPIDGVYYHQEDEQESMLLVVDKGTFTVVLAVPETSGAYMKMDYSYTQSNWRRFIGRWYFSGNSFLSLKKAQHDGQPVTVKMKFKSGSASNVFFSNIQELTLDDVISPVTEYLYFNDDGVIMDDIYYEKMNKIPKEMQALINILEDY